MREIGSRSDGPRVPSDDAGAMAARESVAARLLAFGAERFPPVPYLPMICLLAAAGYVPSAASHGHPFDPARFAVAAGAVALAMLHMRVEDELRDADVDRAGRPWRPLPRGLVTERELAVAGAAAILLAALLAATLGPRALAGFLPAAGYIALADSEFLGRTRAHPDLAAYALVHSPIVPLLLAFAWFADPAAVPDATLAALVVLAWGAGLGMEVARKTCAPGEERPWVETYSAAMGRRHALVFGAGALAVGLAGGALDAIVAGSGPAVAVAALTAGCAVLACAVHCLQNRGRRATQLAGTLGSVAILLGPIGIALLTGRVAA